MCRAANLSQLRRTAAPDSCAGQLRRTAAPTSGRPLADLWPISGRSLADLWPTSGRPRL